MAEITFEVDLNVEDESRRKGYAEITYDGEKLVLAAENGKHHDVKLVTYLTDRLMKGNWLRLYKIHGARRAVEYKVMEALELRRFKVLLMFGLAKFCSSGAKLETQSGKLILTSGEKQRLLELFAHCNNFGEVGPLQYTVIGAVGPPLAADDPQATKAAATKTVNPQQSEDEVVGPLGENQAKQAEQAAEDHNSVEQHQPSHETEAEREQEPTSEQRVAYSEGDIKDVAAADKEADATPSGPEQDSKVSDLEQEQSTMVEAQTLTADSS